MGIRKRIYKEQRIKRHNKLNRQGQMLIEVIGAIIVASIILTSAAMSLVGHWGAVKKISKIVPDTLAMEGEMKNVLLQGCQSNSNCSSTSDPDLKLARIKSILNPDKTIPMLVYAP